MVSRTDFEVAWEGYCSRLRRAGWVWFVTVCLVVFFAVWPHDWSAISLGLSGAALLFTTIFMFGNLYEARPVFRARKRADVLPEDAQVRWASDATAGVIVTRDELIAFGAKVARVVPLRADGVTATHDAAAGHLLLRWSSTAGKRLGRGVLTGLLSLALFAEHDHGPSYTPVDFSPGELSLILKGPPEHLARAVAVINGEHEMV